MDGVISCIWDLEEIWISCQNIRGIPETHITKNSLNNRMNSVHIVQNYISKVADRTCPNGPWKAKIEKYVDGREYFIFHQIVCNFLHQNITKF